MSSVLVPHDAPEEADPEAPGIWFPDVEVWAAVHTNARAEKVVAGFLEKRGVSFFLPMRQHRRTYGGRIRESSIPLFPGYVFYDHAAVDRRLVFATRRVARILVPDEPRQLATDLENIARALEVEPSLKPSETFQPGMAVRVVDGPLMGVEGTMIRRGKATLLVIRVHFTGFAAEVNVDEALVEPLVQ